MILSRVRFAAGVGVLSTGLLIAVAGGATATAEPGPGSHGNNGSGTTTTTGSTTTGPLRSIAGALRQTIEGLTAGLAPGFRLGHGSTVTTVPSVTATPTATAAPTVTAMPTVTTGGGGTPTVTPTTTPAQPRLLSVLAPVNNLVTIAVAPLTNFVQQVPGQIAPLANEVQTATNNLITQETDVITQVQDLLTSVVGGGASQLQTDLSTLLGVTASTQPAADTTRAIDGAALAAAPVALFNAPTSVPRSVQLFPVSGIPQLPQLASPAPLSAADGIATRQLGRESAQPGTAPVAPDMAGPLGVRLHFGPAFGALLRSASLWELAAVALPGIGGLVLFTLAGVGVGRRQAKAQFALQMSAVARFARPSPTGARPGPLGVVRSGSLVVFRKRMSHARPRPVLENVA